MPEHTCNTCHKQFNQKAQLTAHLNRKRPCQAVAEAAAAATPALAASATATATPASDDLRFSSAVAALAQQLKGDGRYTGSMSLKDTAALARSARGDDPFGLRNEFVQLVDGDCAVQPGWIAAALAGFVAHPAAVVLCGRRRERFPEASVYNALADREWDTPVGQALACGGDVLMRFTAVQAVGGYEASLIAGEEPDLCRRLRAAGGEHIDVFVITVDDPETNLRAVRMVRRLYPDATVLARARNRQHAWRLMDLSAEAYRETLGSSLEMAQQVLVELGVPPETAAEHTRRFRAHDEKLLRAQYLVYDDDGAVIQTARDAISDLERLFEADASGDGTPPGVR